EETLISDEPLTVILSQKGWIRAAKGHEVDGHKLNYRSGDGFFAAAAMRSTQTLHVFDDAGRNYSTRCHDLPSVRSLGEPLTSRFNPPPGSLFIGLLSGEPDQKVVIVSGDGYGFISQLGSLSSKNRAGKAVLTLPEDIRALPPITLSDDQQTLALLSRQGRLLLLNRQELPHLSKGRGHKLIDIHNTDLRDNSDGLLGIVALHDGNAIQIIAGKRQLLLKPKDLERFHGKRGNRGILLPRGLQRVDAFSLAF
ncbi:MAG: DNA topoisomerase IV subunit A, partial [Methylococcales bacterium]|nr:DNA topoisomerase IV subunit A [Methylococcales bacterium]